MSHASDRLTFECVVCSIPFDTIELLSTHVQLVHDADDVGSAPSGSSESTASPHRNGHARGTPKPELLASKMSLIPGFQKSLKCFVCDEQFPDEIALDQHRLLNHCMVPKSDRCGVCYKTLAGFEDFLRHSEMHADGVGEMSCVICRQTVRGDAQLRMHGEYHLSVDSAISSKCTICEKMVPLDEYAQHLLHHSFNFDSPTEKHSPSPTESASEGNGAQLVCHCGQQFDDAQELSVHTLEHLKDAAEGGSGTSVGMPSFGSPGGASGSRHRPVQYGGSFKCPKCPKSFPSLSALQGHSHVHMGTRSYRCDKCTQCFSSAGRLVAHQKRHAVEKDVRCQICDERFPRQEQLNFHMKSVHELNLTSFIATTAES
ncbi:zinc finger protein [Aphelenchoides avenae]|nr:zinc finger protein [Aphelenchus avenae]